jgi:hypothetical protein
MQDTISVHLSDLLKTQLILFVICFFFFYFLFFFFFTEENKFDPGYMRHHGFVRISVLELWTGCIWDLSPCLEERSI